MKNLCVEVENGDRKAVKCSDDGFIEIHIFCKLEGEMTEAKVIQLSWNEEESVPVITTEELVDFENVISKKQEGEENEMRTAEE